MLKYYFNNDGKNIVKVKENVQFVAEYLAINGIVGDYFDFFTLHGKIYINDKEHKATYGVAIEKGHGIYLACDTKVSDLAELPIYDIFLMEVDPPLSDDEKKEINRQER